MNYYIDTEFIEGTQNKTFLGFTYIKTKPTIDLISIGIVAEDGREYYAISKDFNLKEAWNRFDVKPDIENGGTKKVYWIRENVLKPIWVEKCKEGFSFKNSPMTPHGIGTLFTYKNFKKLLNIYGKSNSQIAKEIKEFVYDKENVLYNQKNGGLDSVGDVKSKIEFYGYYSAYDWVVFCQLFGIMMNIPNGFPFYCRDLKQIADNIWETTGKETRFKSPKGEHNALVDARWNKDFHSFLTDLCK